MPRPLQQVVGGPIIVGDSHAAPANPNQPRMAGGGGHGGDGSPPGGVTPATPPANPSRKPGAPAPRPGPKALPEGGAGRPNEPENLPADHTRMLPPVTKIAGDQIEQAKRLLTNSTLGAVDENFQLKNLTRLINELTDELPTRNSAQKNNPPTIANLERQRARISQQLVGGVDNYISQLTDHIKALTDTLENDLPEERASEVAHTVHELVEERDKANRTSAQLHSYIEQGSQTPPAGSAPTGAAPGTPPTPPASPAPQSGAAPAPGAVAPVAGKPVNRLNGPIVPPKVDTPWPAAKLTSPKGPKVSPEVSANGGRGQVGRTDTAAHAGAGDVPAGTSQSGKAGQPPKVEAAGADKPGGSRPTGPQEPSGAHAPTAVVSGDPADRFLTPRQKLADEAADAVNHLASLPKGDPRYNDAADAALRKINEFAQKAKGNGQAEDLSFFLRTRLHEIDENRWPWDDILREEGHRPHLVSEPVLPSLERIANGAVSDLARRGEGKASDDQVAATRDALQCFSVAVKALPEGDPRKVKFGETLGKLIEQYNLIDRAHPFSEEPAATPVKAPAASDSGTSQLPTEKLKALVDRARNAGLEGRWKPWAEGLHRQNKTATVGDFLDRFPWLAKFAEEQKLKRTDPLPLDLLLPDAPGGTRGGGKPDVRLAGPGDGDGPKPASRGPVAEPAAVPSPWNDHPMPKWPSPGSELVQTFGLVTAPQAENAAIGAVEQLQDAFNRNAGVAELDGYGIAASTYLENFLAVLRQPGVEINGFSESVPSATHGQVFEDLFDTYSKILNKRLAAPKPDGNGGGTRGGGGGGGSAPVSGGGQTPPGAPPAGPAPQAGAAPG